MGTPNHQNNNPQPQTLANKRTLKQVPCHHIAAAFRDENCPKDVHLWDLLEHSSLREWCKQTPPNAIGLVWEPWNLRDIPIDATVKPLPCGPARSGRRRKFGRWKSRLELMSNIVKKGANGSTFGYNKCRRCGQEGHTTKTCGTKS